MDHSLPNGWSMTPSNELHHASDGEIYETRGVPPHVETPYLDPGDVSAGRDVMLDHVLQRSRGRA
jgi:C-terminal processing protease CtpA/Prc